MLAPVLSPSRLFSLSLLSSMEPFSIDVFWTHSVSPPIMPMSTGDCPHGNNVDEVYDLMCVGFGLRPLPLPLPFMIEASQRAYSMSSVNANSNGMKACFFRTLECKYPSWKTWLLCGTHSLISPFSITSKQRIALLHLQISRPSSPCSRNTTATWLDALPILINTCATIKKPSRYLHTAWKTNTFRLEMSFLSISLPMRDFRSGHVTSWSP